MNMELPEAHDILRQVGKPQAITGWDPQLTSAVQRGLAEVYLLNPHDDVDGKVGQRTRAAWSVFQEDTKLPINGSIDRDCAQQLINISKNRFAFIGSPLPVIRLENDFEFRRKQNLTNKALSASAIIRAAQTQGLTKPQIAYILATAEHESANFATLEEFATGAKYEGRSDLGNIKPGDGPRFKGRGYVQLTGRNNYTAYAKHTGIKLVNLPLILMNWPALSVLVLVDGMKRGAFTGRRLDEFVNAGRQDFVGARRVVNGTDKAGKIAQQAQVWLKEL